MLLMSNIQTGSISVTSSWHDVAQTVLTDARCTRLVVGRGPTPRDLFFELVEDLAVVARCVKYLRDRSPTFDCNKPSDELQKMCEEWVHELCQQHAM